MPIENNESPAQESMAEELCFWHDRLDCPVCGLEHGDGRS